MGVCVGGWASDGGLLTTATPPPFPSPPCLLLPAALGWWWLLQAVPETPGIGAPGALLRASARMPAPHLFYGQLGSVLSRLFLGVLTGNAT